MAKIVPVDVTARTSKEAKAKWESEGKLAEAMQKLSYKYLAGLGDTETGTEIKNILHGAFSQIAEVLDSKIKNPATKAVYLEGISVLDERVCALAFRKDVYNEAVRRLSGLEFPDTDKTPVTDSEDEISEIAEEL